MGKLRGGLPLALHVHMGKRIQSSANTLNWVSKLATHVVLLWALTGAIALGQPHEIPSQDPSREWLGAEYAETLFHEFKRLYPDIEIVIDENALSPIDSDSNDNEVSLRAAALRFAGSLTDNYIPGTSDPLATLVTATRDTLPSNISSLAEVLEHGHRLRTREDRTTAENQLKQWVLNRPEESIAPHEFMIEALRLCNGRVVDAWALAWNITRENWGTAATRNFSNFHSRFISLTGERHLWRGAAHYIVLPESKWRTSASTLYKERDFASAQKVQSSKRLQLIVTKRGDEFSYLYHRIGIELFSMITAKVSHSAWTGWVLGSAGALGEYFKYPVTAGIQSESSKRINNDLAGAKSGTRLFQLFSGQTKPKLTQPFWGAATYLKSNSKKYGPKYQLPPERPVEYFGRVVDKKFYSVSMSTEELRLRFYHAVNFDSDIFNPVLISSNGDSERIHLGLVEYMRNGAGDQELNALIKKWLDGYRARPDFQDVNTDLDLDNKQNEIFIKDSRLDFEYDKVTESLNRQLQRVLMTADQRNRSTNILKTQNTGMPTLNSCRLIFAN